MKKYFFVGVGILIIFIAILFFKQPEPSETPLVQDVVQESVVEEKPIEDIIPVEAPKKNEVTIELRDRVGFTRQSPYFTETQLTINAGDAVTFKNDDHNPHVLHFNYLVGNDDNKRILPHEKNHLAAGSTTVITFPEPGEVAIADLWSKTLRMKILVV